MRFDRGIDQADGLRRLLVGNQTRLISVLAGKSRVGKTSVTINLAMALARSGKDVLVLDESSLPNNLLDGLGLYARHDLLDVAQGKCRVREALLGSKGFSVLPAARARQVLSKLSSAEQQRLEDALAEVSGGVDVTLVDAALSAGQAVAASSANGAALLLVIDATTSGITESYALIKRLATENGRLRFEVLVNKVDDEQAALTVFSNMAALARRDLATRLEYAGYIPRDDKLPRAARLGQSVLEAFPNATSAAAFLHLAQNVMHFPVCQGVLPAGVRPAVHSLFGHALPLPTRHSREAAQVVN